MPSKGAKEKKIPESKYMELSDNDLYPVVISLSKAKEHVLIDMYRQHLEEALENVTDLKEELKIIKKYFGDRFVIVKDDVSKLTTYPDNYNYDFYDNCDDLCQRFLKLRKQKAINIYNVHKSEPIYGFQGFVNRYNKQPQKITVRIRKTSLEHYKELFKQFIIQEVAKDRNKYRFTINFVYKPSEYPNKSPGFFFDDNKKLLINDKMELLEDKIKRLLKIRKGKSVLYHIELFTSTYLSEVICTKSKSYFDDKFAKYNKKIQYPTKSDIEYPEEYIGSVYEIIKQLPKGTKVINIETILRDDLIWRFRKFQQAMKDKYPTKPGNHKIDIAFHGTREDRLSTIVRDGLMIPKRENGLSQFTCGSRYGNGIYLSPDARFSMHYCRGDSCLLVCAVIPGRKYTCDQNKWGSDLTKGYDSHISQDGTELVLFEEAQVLPCVVIHFTIDNEYQDWWNVYYNGIKKPMSYRDRMKTMNKKEKQAYLQSFAESYLSYGFGKGKKMVVEDVVFPDEVEDYDSNGVEFYGSVNNEHYNKYQKSRYEYGGYNPNNLDIDKDN